MKPTTLRKALLTSSQNIATHLGLADALLALHSSLNERDHILLGENHAHAWRAITQRGKLCVHSETLSIATGCAIAGKLDRRHTFCVLGDGELQHGSVWEAALFASAHKLPLTALIDRNGIQLDGHTEHVIPLEPLDAKWQAFGWNVTEIDGHSQKDIKAALEDSRASRKPTAIIMHTTPGKGVPFIENEARWHKKLTNAQCEIARAYLDNA